MKKKNFKIKGKVWIWPGSTANWFFIYVDGKVRDEIREIVLKRKVRRGFGSVKVKATIGKTYWETSLFPSKKENCYIMPLKKQIRKIEDIVDGDAIEVKLKLI